MDSDQPKIPATGTCPQCGAQLSLSDLDGLCPKCVAKAAFALTEPPANNPALLAESAGAQIGPYKLLRRLGEGGMGSVWMADQSAPVRRMVALKLIKPGMDSSKVLARFEAERQATTDLQIYVA
jgi:hypothetical protein